MSKKLSTTIKLSGDTRLEQVHGCVTANSLSEGKKWIAEIYDKPMRMVRGSFGKA